MGLSSNQFTLIIQPMYIDSHAHLTVPTVVDHVEEVLQRAQQKQVKAIVNICIDGPSLERAPLIEAPSVGF